MPARVIRFSEFTLDCDRFELLRSGLPVKLEKIPMELLILLVEKDGHLVTRQQIIERLWGNEVFVDTEHGINTAVRKLRQALGDDPERSRFVQTVTGKGYRFIAEQNGNAPATEARKKTSETEAQTGAAKRRIFWPIVMGLVTVSALFAGALRLNTGGLRDRIFSVSPGHQIRTIAVLPLANLSGDPALDYFSDGMTDELITMLAKNTSLRVISRTSAMQYKSVNRRMRDIARDLGVDGIVEGSVKRLGNRVHMTVQLIHAPSDTHVWAESYERELDQAYSLPTEISQAIAKEVELPAVSTAPQRYINPEAHDAYLHGRYFWFAGNYDRSKDYFDKAIQLQPDYASAWSGLADYYAGSAASGRLPSRESIPQAKQAAERAVELDDSLPEAHNSLAAVRFFGDWDLKSADEESQRAVALKPSYAEASHLRCYILEVLNRPDEAVEEQQRGMELDPFARPWALGLALLRARRLDAAVKELQLRTEAQPQDATTHFILADAYWQKGMSKEFAQEMEKAYLADGDKTSATAVHFAFASGGRKSVAEWDLKRDKARAHKQYISPWNLAYLSARLQRKTETLGFLEDAYHEHSARIIFLQVEPVFDFLHSDERYRALVKEMGLTPRIDPDLTIPAR